MKRYLPLLLVLIMAISCKKDKNEQPVQASTGLAGKWELRRESGGLAADRIYAAGNGTTLQFNADSSFTQYTTFQLTNQGVYSVVEQTAGMPQFKFLVLYLNHNLYNGIDLRPDTLIIGNTASDGIAYTYLRQ